MSPERDHSGPDIIGANSSASEFGVRRPSSDSKKSVTASANTFIKENWCRAI